LGYAKNKTVAHEKVSGESDRVTEEEQHAELNKEKALLS